MNTCSVSVIIPAYRAAHTIGRALTSVFAQNALPEQVLVVDDGSPDDIAPSLSPFVERVHLLRKPNGGAASARNLGLDNATGDFVAFLDADDYWEPHKLECQLDIFRSFPEIGLTCSRWFTQMPGEARVNPPAVCNALFDHIIRATGESVLSVATKMWTSTILARRELIADKRFTPGLEPAEDRDLWIQLVSQAPVYMTSQPLATYVQEAGSLCRTNVDRDYGNMLRVLHRHSATLGKNGLRAWEAQNFRQWAARHLGSGDPRSAIKPAWQRFIREPLSPEAWWILSKSVILGSAPARKILPAA